jgi:hypothetical protein
MCSSILIHTAVHFGKLPNSPLHTSYLAFELFERDPTEMLYSQAPGATVKMEGRISHKIPTT